MKKIILIAAAAAMVLSSCSKNSISENYSDANQVGFSSYSGRATKANGSFVTSGNLPDNSYFGVYCYKTGNASFDATSNTANFMANVDVKYDGTSYTYSPLRYWPSDGANNLLSFFAYYPYTNVASPAPTAGITSQPTSSTTGLGTFGFTVPSEAKDQIDFMISDVVKDQQFTSNTTKNGQVDLKFHHMLTQVNFKAKATDEYTGTTIIIESVNLTNINSTGTLTVDPTATASEWAQADPSTGTTFVVPLSTTASNYTFGPDAANYTTVKDFTTNNETTNSATFLMMPQKIADNAQLIVKYTYKTDGMAAPIENTKTVLLKNAVAAWDKNQSITYTISIGLNAITFTAEVADWKTLDSQPEISL